MSEPVVDDMFCPNCRGLAAEILGYTDHTEAVCLRGHLWTMRPMSGDASGLLRAEREGVSGVNARATSRTERETVTPEPSVGEPIPSTPSTSSAAADANPKSSPEETP